MSQEKVEIVRRAFEYLSSGLPNPMQLAVPSQTRTARDRVSSPVLRETTKGFPPWLIQQPSPLDVQ